MNDRPPVDEDRRSDETGPGGEPAREPDETLDDSPPIIVLPRWVGLGIGVVLVCIAALAVWTGTRDHASLEERSVRKAEPLLGREVPDLDGGVPGAPEAGASRVHPGDTTPDPRAPEPGASRVTIVGTPEGVVPTIRATVSRGMLLQVEPSDALVYVNDQMVGRVSDFGSEDQIYDFPAPGEYSIRFELPGYQTWEYVIVADENAMNDIAVLETTLAPE